MRVQIDVELPSLPKPRRRIGLALVLALALAVPGFALASHQFGDVPDSNPFHNDIAAIADAGVTGGCGGGNYCPKANVTREQMAAFMNRLGALGPGKSPVVNADRLDGMNGLDVLLGTAPIPSGVTVIGWHIWDRSIVADNEDVLVTIELPARAPQPLSNVDVNFSPGAVGGDDDAACTGTANAPSAPPGKVCIYVDISNRVDGGSGYNALNSRFNDRFFTVKWNTDGTAGQDVYLRFSWAYTAP